MSQTYTHQNSCKSIQTLADYKRIAYCTRGPHLRMTTSSEHLFFAFSQHVRHLQLSYYFYNRYENLFARFHPHYRPEPPAYVRDRQGGWQPFPRPDQRRMAPPPNRPPIYA